MAIDRSLRLPSSERTSVLSGEHAPFVTTSVRCEELGYFVRMQHIVPRMKMPAGDRRMQDVQTSRGALHCSCCILGILLIEHNFTEDHRSMPPPPTPLDRTVRASMLPPPVPPRGPVTPCGSVHSSVPPRGSAAPPRSTPLSQSRPPSPLQLPPAGSSISVRPQPFPLSSISETKRKLSVNQSHNPNTSLSSKNNFLPLELDDVLHAAGSSKSHARSAACGEYFFPIPSSMLILSQGAQPESPTRPERSPRSSSEVQRPKKRARGAGDKDVTSRKKPARSKVVNTDDE